MNPFHKASLIAWLLLRSMPPVPPGRLLMPAVFLSSWMGLRAFGATPDVAFVFAAVFAQTAQVWGVMPMTAWRQRQRGGSEGAVRFVIFLMIGVLALQIVMMDVIFTQRLLSGYCAAYALVMVVGAMGDATFLNAFAPVRKNTSVPLEFRRHLLRLYALNALLVLATNEALVAAQLPLAQTVAVLSFLPLVLFYAFEVLLRLTCPRLDEPDS